MGMLWREALEGAMEHHHRRLNVVHVFREESEGDELDDELGGKPGEEPGDALERHVVGGEPGAYPVACRCKNQQDHD